MSKEILKSSIYRVSTLEKALDVLDSFDSQHIEMNLSEVVNRTGLGKAAAKRFLFNLAARGYLQQDPKTKKYQLGLRLFELGGIIFSSFSLRKTANHHMSYLQSITGATVLLGVMMEDQLVYMDKREGSSVIRISSDIGWRRPLHYGMLGMVLMAHLPKEEIEKVLEKDPLQAYTRHSIVDKGLFLKHLRKIRIQSYAIDREGVVEGMTGIAAPIRNYTQRVIAALGIAFLSSDNQLKSGKEGIASTIDLLKKTCENISKELGAKLS